MKKALKSFLGLCCGIAMLASPVLLSADHCERPHTITHRDVAGTYQLSGFSNSLDGAGSPTSPQSQALVGQGTFNRDGTGTLNFIDFAVIVGGGLVDIHQEAVPFTWTLGPINGYGTVTLFNFPSAGVNPTFAISFKLHHGEVTGFSQVIIDNGVATSVTPRWTLIQGDRFE